MQVPRAAFEANAPIESVEYIVCCHLVQHRRGLVLWDTGFDPRAAADLDGIYGAEAVRRLQLTFTPEQRLDVQIRALGWQLDDVTHVILSHAHWDHTGGLRLFPNAEIYVGAGEMAHAFWPDLPHAAASFRLDDLANIPRCRYREISGDLDLFGDGSVVILSTPGHTPGELSLLVRLPNQEFLLTGDTVHLRSFFVDPRPLTIDHDHVKAVQSINRLKLLAEARGSRVWINHDVDDWHSYGGAAQFD